MAPRVQDCCVPFLVLCVAGASTARANTFRVDDSGGADFTDIQAAITEASPGDVILVEPGTYSEFTVRKSLSILGSTSVQITGAVQVLTLPAAGRVVISNMQARSARVDGCAGRVVLDGMAISASASQLRASRFIEIENSADVRITRTTVDPLGMSSGTPEIGVSVAASRVEITRSAINGAPGESQFSGVSDGGPGGPALFCASGSNVHVSTSTLVGGSGGNTTGNEFGCCNGGDGAPGILVDASSRLLLTGTTANLVRGGDNGLGDDCPLDGNAAYGLDVVLGGSVRVSGATIQGGSYACGGSAPATHGAVNTPAPRDPSLEAGTIVPGGRAMFSVNGAPGARVQLWLGLEPTVVDVATEEDKLVVPLATYDLGLIPAGGTVSSTIPRFPPRAMIVFPFGSPVELPPGLMVVAQARTVDGADKRFTQSLPIVLH